MRGAMLDCNRVTAALLSDLPNFPISSSSTHAHVPSPAAMDPLTVISTVCTVSSGVYKCVTALYSFLENVKVVDAKVQALYDETRSLQQVIASIGSVLEDASVQTQDKLPL